MTFNSEGEFEFYLRDLIHTKICAIHTDLVLFQNKKAVDILICRNGNNPKAFFIEVKFHQKSHGRMGFGGTKGKGFQPEIISKAPDYFESNLRWIIADESTGNNHMLFVPSEVIRNYLAGGKLGEKHNNIQSKIFNEVSGFNEESLRNELENWFLN